MIRAVWNGAVLAEAEQTVVVEGNHYFPPESLNREFFVDSPSISWCSWKGFAGYYTVIVDGEDYPDCAWYYPKPKPAAVHLPTKWRSQGVWRSRGKPKASGLVWRNVSRRGSPLGGDWNWPTWSSFDRSNGARGLQFELARPIA